MIIPLVLWWVGASHVGPLFTGEFTQQLGSIEVSYVQMAQFLADSLPWMAWQPLWYFGYPLSLIYTPFLPFFELVSHLTFGWSFSHAYRVLTAFAYAGSLIVVYFFVRELFKNTLSGVIAAIWYGIVPSIISLLHSSVATDRFAQNFIEPRRFTILVRWGEGPHIVSLFFLPIAALFLLRFWRTGNKWTLVCGVLFSTLVVLTNSVGAWGFVLLAFSLLVGELIEHTNQWQQTIVRTFIFIVISYGVAAFWFNPLFLSTFFREGSGPLGFWRNQFPWGWLILIAGFSIFLLLAKKILSRFTGVTASMLFFLVTFGLVHTYYASGSERLELVPQVLRLTTEVDLATAFAVSASSAILGYFLLKKGIYWYMGGMVAASLVLFLFVARQIDLMDTLPQFTQPLESTNIELSQTPEYGVATTLQTLVTGDERVFVPGNYGFYLNYFTKIPQLRGALFQSSIHEWPDHIYYQMTNGIDSDIALAWLKATNVGWLVFNGPREIFGDYKVKREKFDSVLTFHSEKNGDLYFQVPLTDASLAKAIPQTLGKVKTPINAIDSEPLFEYVKLMETHPGALTIKQIDNGSYSVKGTTNSGEEILVQIAYAPGWKAKDTKGKTLKVLKDPLSFIIIEPFEAGKQDIVLSYNAPWSVRFGYFLTFGSIVFLLYILVKAKNPLGRVKVEKKENPMEEE